MVCQTERDDGGQNATATNILLPRLRSRSCKGRAVSPMQWRHWYGLHLRGKRWPACDSHSDDSDFTAFELALKSLRHFKVHAAEVHGIYMSDEC